MKYILLVTACVFYPWDRQPSLLYIEFFHTGLSIFTRSLHPKKFPVVPQWMWFFVGSTMIEFVLGFIQTSYSDPLQSFVFSAGSIVNTVGAFLNVVTW